MRALHKALDRITSVFAEISGSLFGIVVIVVIVNIIGRSFFNTPVRGAIEIVQLGVLLCAGIVLSRTGFDNRHIAVTFFVEKLPTRGKAVTVALGKLICTAVFGVISFLFVLEIPKAIQLNKLTDTFRFPFEYLYIVLMVSFTMATIIFAYQFFLAIRIAITGKLIAGVDEPEEKKTDDSGPNEL